MEETKRILIQNIQEWLKIDNEMRLLRKEMKSRREQKKTLTSLLVDIMKANQIDEIFLGLSWISPEYKNNPNEEISSILNIKSYLEEDTDTLYKSMGDIVMLGNSEKVENGREKMSR